MQVSYDKPTLNDIERQEGMGAWRLRLPLDAGE